MSFEIPEDVAKLVDWVPVKRYMDLYKETKPAIQKRIVTGAWKRGMQWNKPEGGGLWISLKGVNEWASALDQHQRDVVEGASISAC